MGLKVAPDGSQLGYGPKKATAGMTLWTAVEHPAAGASPHLPGREDAIPQTHQDGLPAAASGFRQRVPNAYPESGPLPVAPPRQSYRASPYAGRARRAIDQCLDFGHTYPTCGKATTTGAAIICYFRQLQCWQALCCYVDTWRRCDPNDAAEHDICPARR